MAQQHGDAAESAQAIRAFLSAHDASDASDRQVVLRIRELVHGEQYRREREQYHEWVDFGGES